MQQDKRDIELALLDAQASADSRMDLGGDKVASNLAEGIKPKKIKKKDAFGDDIEEEEEPAGEDGQANSNTDMMVTPQKKKNNDIPVMTPKSILKKEADAGTTEKIKKGGIRNLSLICNL